MQDPSVHTPYINQKTPTSVDNGIKSHFLIHPLSLKVKERLTSLQTYTAIRIPPDFIDPRLSSQSHAATHSMAFADLKSPLSSRHSRIHFHPAVSEMGKSNSYTRQRMQWQCALGAMREGCQRVKRFRYNCCQCVYSLPRGLTFNVKQDELYSLFLQRKYCCP